MLVGRRARRRCRIGNADVSSATSMKAVVLATTRGLVTELDLTSRRSRVVGGKSFFGWWPAWNCQRSPDAGYEPRVVDEANGQRLCKDLGTGWQVAAITTGCDPHEFDIWACHLGDTYEAPTFSDEVPKCMVSPPLYPPIREVYPLGRRRVVRNCSGSMVAILNCCFGIGAEYP